MRKTVKSSRSAAAGDRNPRIFPPASGDLLGLEAPTPWYPVLHDFEPDIDILRGDGLDEDIPARAWARRPSGTRRPSPLGRRTPGKAGSVPPADS
ncbi:acetone carboxylase subunit gamma [uncultured Amaricoccus sp.]|uniref:acetone carboxylase subunit gamma n=1 Tax=uncultured Amaricoccus sp. TaxID=339341 RepID=UPI002621CD79|nr:acetone carboxylase subunit gamma [uncultured Amaricoccus sp.]